MKIIKNIAITVTTVILLCLLCKQNVYADLERHENVPVYVNEQRMDDIRGLVVNYNNNLYISLRGVAFALKDSNKAFYPDFSNDAINITLGLPYDGNAYAWSEEELAKRSNLNLQRNSLFVNGNARKYYSIVGKFSAEESDETDAFMNLLTIGMLLDTDIQIDDDGLMINTTKSFDLTEEEFEGSGYVQGVNSILIGDGTTGEIYYAYDVDEVVPIASTTKLMTYYVMMDAVSEGEISLDDNITISKRAHNLSEDLDGVIPLGEGSIKPLNELIYGMLLRSSNECALAIAEHVAGSEAEFVSRMNKKSKAIGLTRAEFYNCNGLPVYDNNYLPAKKQNRMTAGDMFVLAKELINDYPEVLDITSVISMELPSLQQKINNTNALLYNLDNAKGLKTGTTNKSGACLISCVQEEKNGEVHNLISVLFGAENEVERSTISEAAMRMALQRFANNDSAIEKNAGIPKNPEDVVKTLISAALRKNK